MNRRARQHARNVSLLTLSPTSHTVFRRHEVARFFDSPRSHVRCEKHSHLLAGPGWQPPEGFGPRGVVRLLWVSARAPLSHAVKTCRKRDMGATAPGQSWKLGMRFWKDRQRSPSQVQDPGRLWKTMQIRNSGLGTADLDMGRRRHPHRQPRAGSAGRAPAQPVFLFG